MIMRRTLYNLTHRGNSKNGFFFFILLKNCVVQLLFIENHIILLKFKAFFYTV